MRAVCPAALRAVRHRTAYFYLSRIIPNIHRRVNGAECKVTVMNNNKEDKILLSQIEDRIRQCEERYMMTHTHFLDLRERSLAEQTVRFRAGLRYDFYGGYEEAERVIAVFLPEYAEDGPAAAFFAADPESDPLTVIRMELRKGSPVLTHRDYLGALMGLGIRREMTGDILVRKDGADVIVLREIAEYILTHMAKAGRANLSVREISISGLAVPEQQREERFASVSSLRTDSILSAAFGLSRSGAAEAVRAGLVFVNGMEASKPDRLLEPGDKLVLRHKGKTVLKSADGRTAKGRIRITLIRYR